MLIFLNKMLDILSECCQNFAFFLNLTKNFRDFPQMQQFWENRAIQNPKIAHFIFVLEMRTFNFRFEKQLINLIFFFFFADVFEEDIFTNI